MAQLQFAFWDGVGGYAEHDETMADVYDEHIRLAQRLEELDWHSYFVIEHQNSPVGRITAPTVFPGPFSFRKELAN
jgi:alkanesulfonate monooxygenase SsuD/methylene tetrahydromethanopterin reductase-like flavin-dependent oxidoreductase (luciferase family)